MPAFVVDSAALSRNIEKLRRFTSAQIIAVVKGNGYGLGMVPYARFLTAQGVALLAVSTAAEAAALRRCGGGVYRLRLIHGYHGGTALRDLCREYARHPRVLRLVASSGSTDLVLREF